LNGATASVGTVTKPASAREAVCWLVAGHGNADALKDSVVNARRILEATKTRYANINQERASGCPQRTLNARLIYLRDW
jgi:hypothetical protein